MIRKLIRKFQAYRDKRFQSRLERVLSNNVIESDLFINGKIKATKDCECLCEKESLIEAIKEKSDQQ